MKLLVLMVGLIASCTAFAAEPLAQESVLDVLTLLLGDKGAVLVSWVCVVGYGWALLRQFIKPENLTWLPNWVIDVLEFAAMNKGYAKNLESLNPKLVKSLRRYK